MTDRITITQDFLAAGRSICQFAKIYASKTEYALVREQVARRDLYQPISNLATRPDTMVGIYVFETDKATHDEEKKRVNRLFLDLADVLLEIAGIRGKKELAEDMKTQRIILESALRPDSDRNPFLVYQQRRSVVPFFTIAMNPLYNESHPRWSPVPMFVVTRQVDVAEVPEPQKQRIRLKMFERTGKVYDADTLYLAENP